MVDLFERGDAAARAAIYAQYLEHTPRYVNNWDLVDSSAYQIVGTFLQSRDRRVLYDLARSASLWERRVAIIATFRFIKNGVVRRHAGDREAVARRPRGPDPQSRGLDAARGRQS